VIDQQLNLTAVRIQPGNEAEQKAEDVQDLGMETVVAIGQGANDAAMLKQAALGICVMSQEGVAAETLYLRIWWCPLSPPHWNCWINPCGLLQAWKVD
jgi:soluble P-type ATPase